MSKHQKEVRRERRKAERTRRSRAVTGGAAALAAAAAIAAGTSAYADPIRYDNPAGTGHFDWFGDAPSDILLDVVLPAGSQPGTAPASSFQQTNLTNLGFVEGTFGSNGELLVGGAYGYDLIGLASGELIPSGDPWKTRGYIYYPGYGSELPEGTPTYLGIKLDQGSGWQYGWVGVVRTHDTLDAFAWGYETEVGVPIEAGVPEPGTLALLAMGAVGVLSRRRK